MGCIAIGWGETAIQDKIQRMPDSNLTLFIQAGGASKRMGADKSLLPFLGQPLIQRIVERGRALTADIRIVSNETGKYAFLDLAVIPDPVAGVGPLAGLYAAFAADAAPYAAVIGCDMPFFSVDMLRWQLAVLIEMDCDCVVPVTERGLEPLHAVYRRETCRSAVKNSLDQGNHRLISWFSEVRVREVTMDEWKTGDPSQPAFINVNSPEEFAAAEALALELGL